VPRCEQKAKATSAVDNIDTSILGCQEQFLNQMREEYSVSGLGINPGDPMTSPEGETPTTRTARAEPWRTTWMHPTGLADASSQNQASIRETAE